MKKAMLVFALAIAAVSACAQSKVYTPKGYPDVRVEKDLRYGERRALESEGFAYKSQFTVKNEWGFARNGHATGQDYDLYYPAKSEGKLPVFVYIHGGAWCWAFDKSDHEEFFEMIANDGWAVFAPDYILQNDLFNRPEDGVRAEATIDEQLRDIDLFMAEVKRVAAARGFDARRIVIAGESAGGHLCSLYAYDAVTPEHLGLGLAHPLDIGLVFNIVGAVDFTDPNWKITLSRMLNGSGERYDAFMSAMSGGMKSEAAAARYSPVPLISPACPRHLLSYSCRAGAVDDGCIPVSNWERLTNALTRCGVPYSGRLFAGTSHCETMHPPAKEARAWYLAELDAYRKSLANIDWKGVTAQVEGRKIEAYPVTLSAGPINKIFDGTQRPRSQTKTGAVLSFDFDKPCEVRIAFPGGVPNDLEIRPLSFANDRRIEHGELVVSLLRPTQFVVTSPSGAIVDTHVFANGRFVAPDEDGRKVRRFAKGEHRPGVVEIGSDETIILDEGAVVHAEVFALNATNATICGRGVFDFSEWDRCDVRARQFRREHNLPEEDTEFACNPFAVFACRNLKVEGVTLKDAPFWTVNIRNGSSDILFENVKIVGNWRYNSDGINVCASERVTVRDCFIRSFDDCLVARASYFHGDDGLPTRRVRFENNRLWCDWGKNCEVWAGHKPTLMDDIVFRGNAFLNVHFTGCDVTTWYCSSSTHIGDVLFADNEYDLGGPRWATVFQSAPGQAFNLARMKEANLLSVDAWAPAANLGNQHFGPADDVSKYLLDYDRIRFVRPRIYGGKDQTLTVKSETTTDYQKISGLVFEDLPKDCEISIKGNVDWTNRVSRAAELSRVLKSNDRSYVFIASHRMDWRHHPENSLAALEGSIALGVDVLEIDLKRTKDGAFVLSHDATVDRCTDGTGAISELTLSQIRALRLREGLGGHGAPLTNERMPTFDEFLRALDGRALVNVDQGSWIGLRELYDIIDANAEPGTVLVKGNLTPAQLRPLIGEAYWRRLADRELVYFPVVYADAADAGSRLDGWNAQAVPLTLAEIIPPRNPAVEFSFSRRFREPGSCRLWINTLWGSLCQGHTDDRSVTRPDEGWGWALAHGATVVQSDRPARLRQYLEAKGRRKLPMAPSDASDRVESLIAAMTLEEKLGQLNQAYTQIIGDTWRLRECPETEQLFKDAAAGRLGSVIWAVCDSPEQRNRLQREAVEKSRFGIPVLFCNDIIHGARTVFPIAPALAGAFEPSLLERAQGVAAAECSAAGVDLAFAPMCDAAVDARWGRVAETCGEDPYLSSLCVAAQVRGFQGADPSAPDRVAACLKHYLGYGASLGGRDYHECDIGDVELRNRHLPPFAAGVRAGSLSVMSSFNTVDGIPAVANRRMLTDILRGDLHFDGAVVSDWGSVGETIGWGVAKDATEAAAKAIRAGNDIDMVSGCYLKGAAEAVAKGMLSISEIDEAVRRVLRLKERLGLFEHPYVDESRLAAEKKKADTYLKLAAECVEKSAVLLKNDGVLPLSAVRKLAVIGPMADDRREMLGCWVPWNGVDAPVVTVAEGIAAALPGCKVSVARGCNANYGDGTEVRTDGTIARVDSAKSTADEQLMQEALKVAAAADVVVMAVGETYGWTGENASRHLLALTGRQQELFDRVAALGKPIVTLVFSGRPLALESVWQKSAAVVYAWQPGSAAGTGLGRLLSGKADFTARLSMSVPLDATMVPVYYNHLVGGRPQWGTYRDYGKGWERPWAGGYEKFPFGFGLSYTAFEYGKTEVVQSDGGVWAVCSVKNTGRRAGVETAQFYVRQLACSSHARPRRELRGFSKVALRPGETKQVRFRVDDAALGYVTRDGREVCENGTYWLWVAPDSNGGTYAVYER